MWLQKSLVVIIATAWQLAVHAYTILQLAMVTFLKMTFQRKSKTNHSKVLKTPLLLEILQGNKLFKIFLNIQKATLDLT